MAEKQQRMKKLDAGDAKNSSLSQQPARGALDVQDVSQRINLDEFSARLDSLQGKKTLPGYKCAMGALLQELPEAFSQKLSEALLSATVEGSAITKVLADYGFEISSNIVRRHRRRMQGLDGCKCDK